MPAIASAFAHGYSVSDVHELSKIDNWFLSKLKMISDFSAALRKKDGGLPSVNRAEMQLLKCAGFSDAQIGLCLPTGDLTEAIVRERRLSLGVTPWVKQIDTLAAEFPARTNYLYITYNGSEHDVSPLKHDWVQLGIVARMLRSLISALTFNSMGLCPIHPAPISFAPYHIIRIYNRLVVCGVLKHYSQYVEFSSTPCSLCTRNECK